MKIDNPIVSGSLIVSGSTTITGYLSASTFVGDGSGLSNMYTDSDTLSYINTLGVVSSSAQLSTEISGAFVSTSASLASNISNNDSRLTTLEGKSLISSSIQLSNQTIPGNLTVGGILTAQEFHTEFVSASIIYQSGSTQFGNSLDDIHNFSGSLAVNTDNLFVSGGRVGIGTTSPTVNLEVKNYSRVTDNDPTQTTSFEVVNFNTNDYAAITSRTYGRSTSGTLFGQSVAGNAFLWASGQLNAPKFIIGTLSNADFILGSNNTERIRITNTGNVGIGTTSPLTKLHIEGPNNNDGDDYAQLYIKGTGTHPLDIAGIVLDSAGSNQSHIRFSNNGSPKFQIRYNEGGTADDKLKFYSFTQVSDLVTIDGGTGNVGIGTTSPTNFGSHTTLSINSSVGGILNLMFNGSNALRIVSANDRTYLFEERNLPITISTNSTERMRINANGNVGIGTTSPSYKLDVYQGDVATTGHSSGDLRLSGNLSGYANNTYPTLKTSGGSIHFDALGTYTGYISWNSGFADVSDGTLKTFVEPIQNATDILMNLEGVRYSWIDGRDNFETHAGFVAQQVLEHYPEAVTLAETGIYGISSPPLIALAVTTIQEQQQQIEELKTTIQSLITRVEQLENQ